MQEDMIEGELIKRQV